MEACKPLEEYAWLVDKVRNNQRLTPDLESAVDTAVNNMPNDYIIKPFIIANRAEVKLMLFTEYDEEMIKKYERIDARKEGREEAEYKSFIKCMDRKMSFDDAKYISGASDEDAAKYLEKWRKENHQN